MPHPKSFAHVARGLFTGANSKRKRKRTPEVLFAHKPWSFGLEDATPQASEWQDFLKNRQHRDGVFHVLCQYIRQTYGHIREKGQNRKQLEWAEHCVQLLRLQMDGEPVMSAYYLTTTGCMSWHNTPDGTETREEDNGIGEGELQALHHAYLVSRQQPPLSGEGDGTSSDGSREGQLNRHPVLVEVVSVDTDIWVAALLAFAVYPSTRNVRVVVRQ